MTLPDPSVLTECEAAWDAAEYRIAELEAPRKLHASLLRQAASYGGVNLSAAQKGAMRTAADELDPLYDPAQAMEAV